jgi:CubicO group peptidase (beta-lactamase class C family)
VDVLVAGSCDPAFEGIREAFVANFAAGLELGASLSISVGGRNVVDLWGGWLDASRSRPWQRDSLVCVFSCTKGVAAIATMAAVADPAIDLDLDDAVARHWPEFAAEGKGEIPVRWLLTHEAGLPALSRRMPLGSLSDWEAMTSALAVQKPWWEPGTAHGYHGVTYGHLIGEVLRRATGRTCGTLVQERLAGPLGVELHMPLPSQDDPRTADLVVDTSPEGTFFDAWDLKTSLGPKAFGNPPDANDPAQCMSEGWKRSEIPAANMYSNARSLDRLYSVLACGGSLDGVALAPPALVAEFGRCQVSGIDRVMELPTAFALGFEHTIPEWRFGPGERTYGHNGSGGSLGLVDPDAGVSLGYAMNRLWWGPSRSDPRWGPIFEALYNAL